MQGWFSFNQPLSLCIYFMLYYQLHRLSYDQAHKTAAKAEITYRYVALGDSLTEGVDSTQSRGLS